MGDQVGISWERERLLEALDAFQRGVSDAPLVRKWNEADVTAANGDRERPMAGSWRLIATTRSSCGPMTTHAR